MPGRAQSLELWRVQRQAASPDIRVDEVWKEQPWEEPLQAWEETPSEEPRPTQLPVFPPVSAEELSHDGGLSLSPAYGRGPGEVPPKGSRGRSRWADSWRCFSRMGRVENKNGQKTTARAIIVSHQVDMLAARSGRQFSRPVVQSLLHRHDHFPEWPRPSACPDDPDAPPVGAGSRHDGRPFRLTGLGFFIP